MRKLFQKSLPLFLLIIFLIFISNSVFSSPITPENAREKAENWIKQKNIQRAKISMLTLPISAQLSKSDSDKLYYIFNIDKGGWVIIAGDDAVQSIVAYSLSGSYVEPNSSPGFNYWIASAKSSIRNAALKMNITPSNDVDEGLVPLVQSEGFLVSKTTREITSAVPHSVNPLLATTWGQGRYYNNRCPIDNLGADGHAITGCVATATAQIMKYHDFPIQGIGAYEYEHSMYGLLSADFSSTTYEWSSMTSYLEGYNSSVATLLYHVGVALHMNYGSYESYANSEVICDVLSRFFGYASGGDNIFKADYSLQDWIDILKNNISSGLPVAYAGWNVDGGHSFVVDGYDDDYFHINWGWDGWNDGYFLMTDLSPNDFYQGYNLYQVATINISPSPLPPYRDMYEPNDNKELSTNIEIGSTLKNHAISPIGDEDWITFSISYPTDVIIRLSGSNHDASLKIHLYDSFMNELANNKWFGIASPFAPSQVGYNNLKAGTYYAKIVDYLNDERILSYDISLLSSFSDETYTQYCISESTAIPKSITTTSLGSEFNEIAYSFCDWTASENLNWVSLSKNSGSGYDNVVVKVEPNNSSLPRNGEVQIAGRTISINQDGSTSKSLIGPVVDCHIILA